MTSESIQEVSDYRLKTDVTMLINQVLKLKQLRPVRYKHLWDNEYHEGFLAHELQALYPSCVTGQKDEVDSVTGEPKYQGVNINFGLIASIVAGIKELEESHRALLTEVTSVKEDFLVVKADHIQLKADFIWHKTHNVAAAHPLI